MPLQSGLSSIAQSRYHLPPRISSGGSRLRQLDKKSDNREETVMLKSITMTVAAIALAVTAWVLLPMRGHEASAEPGQLLINAIDYDIAPGKVDEFLAALKENGAASVKDPGCREFNIAVSQKDPNHVFIFEVYDDAAAVAAHEATEHFKKYKAATAGMAVKREAHPLWSVAMNAKGM
jgi:(4S)-4-hydroxy-5-phosphonooxypentane-2,3-dione isomerase